MSSPLQKASIKRIIAKITEKIDPLLEAGFIYLAKSIKTSYGMSGGSIYREVDGRERQEIDIENTLADQLKFGSRIFDVVNKLPEFTKVKFKFEKGKSTEVKVYSVSMLLNDISDVLQGVVKNKAADKAVCDIDFFENEELELNIEGKVFGAFGEAPNTFFDIKGDTKCLYHALDKEIKKLRFIFENDVLITQADIAIPEFDITPIQVNSNVEEATIKNIDTVFEYLESGEEKKIKTALKCIKSNSIFYQKVENRYLNLLIARSNNPFISIEALPDFMPNKVDIKMLLERISQNNYLSLAYLNRHESKLLVDFIGSVIHSFVNIEDFKLRAIRAESESALLRLIDKDYKTARKGLQQLIAEYPDGWMSQVCQRLLGLKLEKVFFEKTLFSEANQSLVLDGFYFFLGMSSIQAIEMDIHQSETPKIPEIIWICKYQPKINSSSTEVRMPTSSLQFSR